MFIFVLVKQENIKEVTRSDWDESDDKQRIDWLLQVFKDPDDAEKHFEKEWEELPPQSHGNMVWFVDINERVK
jgi:hypothetical protein